MGVVRHGVPAIRAKSLSTPPRVWNLSCVIVRFAPIGIFGLVASTLATTGLGSYDRVLP